MYPEQFDDFKEEFLNDPKVWTLLSQLKGIFEEGYRKHILDRLDEEEIHDGLDMIYQCMRDDMNPDDYTIFDILLFK
jgi:hypothetical protein